MPVPKRYFHVSQDLNHDPELWELTETFGDRSLRVWLELLSSFDKNSNQFKLSGLWVSQLANATKMNLKTVLLVTVWMIDKGWVGISGDQKLAEEWLETSRRLTEEWPKTHRRLAGDLPETCRRMVEEWLKKSLRLSLCATNWLKYNRTQEHKGNTKGAVAAPLPPIPSHPVPKIKKEKSMPSRAAVDAEWLEQLKQNPAYKHINFQIEMGKIDAWLSAPRNKRRQKTHQFVLNWLNKVETPLQLVPVQPVSYRPTKVVL